MITWESVRKDVAERGLAPYLNQRINTLSQHLISAGISPPDRVRINPAIKVCLIWGQPIEDVRVTVSASHGTVLRSRSTQLRYATVQMIIAALAQYKAINDNAQ